MRIARPSQHECPEIYTVYVLPVVHLLVGLLQEQLVELAQRCTNNTLLLTFILFRR